MSNTTKLTLLDSLLQEDSVTKVEIATWLIICLKNKTLITTDGLNHSQNKNHSINETYKAYAKTFNIKHIRHVILKKPQSIHTNVCLPIVGAFFTHFLGYRFTLDMIFHLIHSKNTSKCIKKAKKKCKSMLKNKTFI